MVNTVRHSDPHAKAIIRSKWKEVTGRDVGLPSSFPSSRWVRALPAPLPAPGAVSSSAALIKAGETTARHPDGLYFVVGNAGGQAVADVVGIEVCGSWQNFETKRHTYTDRSLTLRLSSNWLITNRTISKQTKTMWEWAGFTSNPVTPLATARVPVRWATVLYVLAPGDYEKARDELVPYANEYFCRHSSLGSWDAQQFKKFLRSLTWADRFTRTFYNKR